MYTREASLDLSVTGSLSWKIIGVWPQEMLMTKIEIDKYFYTDELKEHVDVSQRLLLD